MAKGLTYEEFQAYAMKHYSKGGDAFVECWDERTFNDFVDQFGIITKQRALDMFKDNLDVERDRAGYWM